MSTAVRRYVHASAGFTPERERLRLLGARYDTQTIRRLRALGSLAGASCLEIGAGAGSVARWLAMEVGPAGRVVATDADPRFLEGIEGPNLEVRRHDVVTDDLETTPSRSSATSSPTR